MTVTKIRVNGKLHRVETSGKTPLLWVIREHLGLTGTKYGCGIAQCGSCTVHLDGAPVRSCIIPLEAAEGKSILTIEGLSKDGDHPLQRAWVKAQVPQCGYCQSGQIMQAASLLQENPNPSTEAIKSHMNGNLCRCGTYNRIIKAIEMAAGDALAGQGD